jgi:hypothetical protein
MPLPSPSRRAALRGLLALGAAPLVGCGGGRVRRSHAHRARRAAERGVSSLLEQQGGDGLFRSATYGLLRSGQSLTPFVAEALAALPDGLRPDAAIDRALGALPALQRDGALGLASLPADYPTYATGLALAGWARRRLAPDSKDAALAWLLAHQLTAARGWGGHPAQGGWAMGAAAPPDPPHAGHVDLSMTRRAVEGLAAAGLTAEHAPMIEARAFVERCRAPDGGFVYSPVELALNKGGCDGDRCRGYGSATTDGLLAARALGATIDDPLIAEPLAFLLGIHRLDANPGIGPGPLQGFAGAMVGCYRAGAAAVFARLGGPDGWREAMIDAVLADQAPDGSWRNPDYLQKEDDPLIAGGFALAALAAAAWGG